MIQEEDLRSSASLRMPHSHLMEQVRLEWIPMFSWLLSLSFEERGVSTTQRHPPARWNVGVANPRFLTSMVSPEFEFAGTLMTRDLPSMWSRVTVVPRTKSEYPRGRDMIKSEPERSNHGCGSISNSMNKSPGSPWPCGAGSIHVLSCAGEFRIPHLREL
jgi:hypothetical protein